MKNKKILPLIFITIGLIFIILAYFGPWYNLSINYTILGVEANYNQQNYLNSIELSGNAAGFDFTQTILLDAMETEGISSAYIEFLQNTKNLTIIAIITNLIALTALIGFLFISDKISTLKKIAIVFSIITFCITILTIVYFMIGWSNIENTIQYNIQNFFENLGIKNPFNQELGFWYTNIKNGNSFSIGPDYSWYIMIFSAVLSWFSAILINRQTS